jgi:hypothetical protein
MMTAVIALVIKVLQDTTRGPHDTTTTKTTAASDSVVAAGKRIILHGGRGIRAEVGVPTGRRRSTHATSNHYCSITDLFKGVNGRNLKSAKPERQRRNA